MDVVEIIERIDFLKTQIDELRPISPDILNRINRKFRFDWDYHSSNIEGNSLTYGETKTFLLHNLTADKKPLRDHLEILGHHEAVSELEDIVSNNKRISETVIRQLHQIMLGSEPYRIPATTANGQVTQRTTYPGQYKSQPNHVVTDADERLYFASPEDTAPKMQELVEWLRNELLKNELHPLIIATTLHHKFIMIHPFDDGNGRIARLLMNLVLMIKGFPPAIILTQDKENYFRALRQADGGEIEGFIIYIGEQLIRSLELFLKGAYGENIEDLDEIDKKIALFKAKLKKPEGGNNYKIRSAEAMLEIVENSLKPLLISVTKKVSQFNDLFVDNLIRINTDALIPERTLKETLHYLGTQNALLALQEERTSPALRNLNDVFSYLSKKASTSQKIKLLFQWKSYKENPENSFNEECSIELVFDEYQYLMNGSEGPYSFSFCKFYHELLTDDEIQKASNQLAEALLEKLQKRLNL